MRTSPSLNTTTNGTQPSWSCACSAAGDIAMTFAFCLIFVLSLAVNSIIGVIVYRTKTMRKSINFFIVNMAMSDLLFPIFLLPYILTKLTVPCFLVIPHPLGLPPFLTHVSVTVSIQNMVLLAVDRFGAVVFPWLAHSSVQSSARSLFSPLGLSR